MDASGRTRCSRRATPSVPDDEERPQFTAIHSDDEVVDAAMRLAATFTRSVVEGADGVSVCCAAAASS